MTHRDPTACGPSPSICALITLDCHSPKRAGSVAYRKTSPGGRAISTSDTMGAIVPPFTDRSVVAERDPA